MLWVFSNSSNQAGDLFVETMSRYYLYGTPPVDKSHFILEKRPII